MEQLFSFGLLVFTSYFTLINPLGIMPVYMTMTMELDDSLRKRTARKAAVVALFTIVLFALSGKMLFDFFHISVNSFRIVGGVIFFLMGKDMLQARLVAVKLNQSEVKSYVNDISVTPLAIPMICGPGAITNTIVLMNDATTAAHKAVFFVGVFLVMILTYWILRSSSRIIKFLGETGNNVLMRLMGLIVMVIAVEFFFSGLTPILRSIFEIQ